MAQPSNAKTVSQYPLPPAKYYRKSAVDMGAPAAPPTPPKENESYHMFGNVYTTDDRQPSLEESGRKRLYDPDVPPCTELRRLNKELLQHFRRLVEDMCKPLPPDAPEKPHQEVIQAIEDTFVNMQFLINSLRPLQAAMDLRSILDRQTNARKDMAEKLKDSVKRAWDLIGEAAEKLSEPGAEQADLATEHMDAAIETGKADANGKAEAEEKGKGGKQDEDESLSRLLAQVAQIAQDPSL